MIESHWRFEGQQFTRCVSIPANTTASLRYPIADVPIFEGGAALEGIEARLEAGFWLLELGSGQYEFSSEAVIPQPA